MKTIIFKSENIKELVKIKEAIKYGHVLSQSQLESIYALLRAIPEGDKELVFKLSEKIGNPEEYEIKILDFDGNVKLIKAWISLFMKLPGYYFHKNWHSISETDNENSEIVYLVYFVSKLTHGKDFKENIIKLYLNVDGKARFVIPNRLQNEFEHLNEFSGSWGEAYRIVVDIMEKGFPQYQLPEIIIH